MWWQAPAPASAGAAGSGGVWTRSWAGLPVEAIANAPDRHDVARVGRVFLDLLPQSPDVHGDGMPVAELAPEPLEELLAGEDLAWVLGEELEQIELACSQLHRLAIDADLVRLHVDHEPAEVEDGAGCWLAAPVAAEDCLDAGDDFAGRGGLDDEIVGAESQTADLVMVLLSGGEEEDRHIPVLADAPQHVIAGRARHHHVEQDTVNR